MPNTHNITLVNPGAGSFKINFGTSEFINKFFYDVIADAVKAYQIVENPNLNVLMTVTPTGIVQIKGTKVIDSSLTKSFKLLSNGNLVARQFITTV